MAAADHASRVASATIAALSRSRPPDDPDLVNARRDLRAARIADELRRVADVIPHDPATAHRVAALLAQAPPMTTSQREAVVRLLARRPDVAGAS
jgi:hypothetical protein